MGRRYRGLRFLSAALCAAALCGCGGASSVDSSEPAVTEPPIAALAALVEERAAVRQGSSALALIAEAWPIESTDDNARPHPERTLTDGELGGPGFATGEGVRPPWSFIFSIRDAPQSIAAVGIFSGDSASGSRMTTFSVLVHVGDLEISRSSYRQFMRAAEHAGSGVLPGDPVLHVYALQEPVDAHHLWLRVFGSVDGATLGLSEFVALTPEQLESLRDTNPSDVAFHELSVFEDDGATGVDLGGFPFQ